MSTQSPDDEDVDPTYLAIFSQHLTDFRAHLVGRTRDEPSYASFYAPNAYWSAAEKDAFFRGLAVHSRLRPDLIAAEVKTKTIPDICSYIALLKQAEQNASKGGRDMAHAKLLRKYHLPAAEVSDEWLAHEERMADRLIKSEHSHALDTLLKEREEETNVHRKATKARKGGARTASNERDREGERARREEFDKWLARKKADWEGRDLLASLDKVSLAALDRMLRDDEEGRAFTLDAHVTLPEGNTVLDAMEVDALGASRPGISEELIDPALLDLSRPSSSMPPPTSPSTSPTMPSFALVEPVQPRTPPSATNPLPEGLGPSSSPSVAPSLTTYGGSTIGSEDISQMSPISRRRHQKRLYMRRKRAQKTGAALDEKAERLKPGRKPKKQPHPNVRATTPVARSGSTGATEQMADEGGVRDGEGPSDDKSAYRHHKVSGKTLPYKRQLDFISNRVDVQRLRREGLDLFHLQSVSKLMHTYNELHDVPSSVGSAISAETLSLLRGLVVQFVSRVMSIAIVVREQERIAKLQTKAWRLTENQVVSTSNVKYALALNGADSLSTRNHFNGLLRKLDLEEDADVDADVNEQANDNDARDNHVTEAAPDEAAHAHGDSSKDQTTDDISLQPLSCLRTIFPPFINPPSSGLHVGGSSSSIDPSVYMPWPPSNHLSSADEPKQDEDDDDENDDDDPYLLLDESDTEEFVRELRHESALDHEDRLYEAEVERTLWKQFGKLPPPALSAQPAHDDPPHARSSDKSPPRKRQKKAQGDDPATREPRDGEVVADERDVEAELFDDSGEDERDDDDRNEEEEEDVVEEGASGAGKKRKKGSARLSQQSLWYRKPNPHGRIKSAVYVVDSDEE